MKLSDMPNLMLYFLLAGMFFVVGIIILSTFQSTQVSSVTVTNEQFTMPALNGNVTLGHYRVTSISSVKNVTGTTFPAANYTLLNPTQTISQLQFLENATVCKTGATCNVTYVYSTYDTGVPVPIQNSIVALQEIPNNWLLLIAVIVAASVLIGIVVKNLYQGDNVGRV